ncbi:MULTISPECIES: zinc ABC transporter substrate-binding protein [unclassified Guyparkeria]|uniref:metal ABC transporter solute-binding protein, Zn/Mn family n=1 Tax=unclassified Guyparkeria TaxID=2626246 RepID=UPI0018D2401D|nr:MULTISPECIES: zinc ABC transporter substrate-binding protein [unclassified Guyparkeria]
MAVFLAPVAPAEEPLAVVATTGMIADAAREIGGEAVSVKGLMGPGVDPHSYRQTRSDIVALAQADLVLSHGLYLEAQMEKFLHRLSRRQSVVAVAEVLPRERLLGHSDYENKFDPHVWMAPNLWEDVVIAIRDALVEARPAEAGRFEKRTEAYLGAIERLNAYAEEATASVPADSRVLLTAHDAFAYFGRAFDFEVIGIQGISTESEAGLRRIRDLVDLLVERDIGAVFVESSVPERNVRALVEGAGARGHEVRVAGTLYSDAMGTVGTYEGTYLGMIDHNVTTIVRALGGQAPEDGMQGRLGEGTQ